MSTMRTIQDDVNSLAMHVLDVADFASGAAAEANDALASGLEKVKAEMQDAFADKLDAFKKEIMGDVQTEASKAVAEVGSKVASLGRSVAVENKPEPNIDLTPKPEASVPAPIVYTTSTEHTATDGIVTTLDHEAGTVTAKDVDGQPVEPKPEAVAAVVQATVDAGVAVPEGLKPEASVLAAEAQPVI